MRSSLVLRAVASLIGCWCALAGQSVAGQSAVDARRAAATEVAQRSDRVSQGTIQSASSFYGSDGRIYTDYSIAEDQAVQGFGDRFFTLRTLGGVVGDLEMTVSETPTFSIGEQTTLYLSREGTHYRLTDASLGKIPVRPLDTTGGDTCYGTSNRKWFSVPAQYSVGSNIPASWVPVINTAAATWNNVASSNNDAWSLSANSSSGNPIVMADLVAEYGGAYSNIYALTTVWSYQSSGQIVKAQTEMASKWTWSTTADSNSADVQNIMTHEFGHWQWLADMYSSDCSSVTMFGTLPLGDTNRRTIHQPDIDGMNSIYGTGASGGTVPPPPALSSPSNGATNLPTSTTLSWAAATGATSYDVYFGTVPNPTLAGNTNSTAYAPSLSPGTTYYWKIAAKNASGDNSSAIYSFSTAAAATPVAPPAPTLASPSNNATNVATSSALTWSGSAGATSYDVYFGTSPSPSLVTNVSGTSYSPGLSASTTYYWKVVAKNSGGSASSSVFSFSTAAPPPPSAPSAPILASPSNNSTGVVTTASLVWSASSGATSYDVYFGTSSNPPLATNVTGTSYTPQLSASTTYYWKIVAKNSGGAASSSIFSFATAAPPISAPSDPSLASPSNNATGIVATASLVWSASSGAASYDVYFGTSSTPSVVANVTGTSYAPGLAASTTYYWKIVAKNSGGSTSSPTFTFTTAAPPPPPAPSTPSLASPSNNATGVVTSASLVWSASSGATSYDVYLGTSSNPSLVTNVTGTSYTPQLVANTTYYWKIVAKNAGGSTASSIFTFQTTAPATPTPSILSAPTLTSPSNGATGLSSKIILTWTSVPGATSYDVYAGTSSNPPLIGNTTATSANFTGTAGSKIYWRVVAKNGNSTATSATSSFTIGTGVIARR